MKITLLILSMAFSAIQALLCYLWTRAEDNAADQFRQFIDSIYSEIPPWTETAFSLGRWWYLSAIACAMMAIYTYWQKSSYMHLFPPLLMAIFGTIAMLYAMYPIHLMLLHAPF
ncbi:hypothetical protein ACVFI8_19255 [Agarivorans sp. MS3-6]|uniref:hypothetical protein n=1 Tax=Agarivorans sp. TSD2052 TaxID=2937286 RepID=UPI00200F322C|nr:hypothetical protein [Agarivorans sp. TSD2052]UPW17023.1 hypothetical protein M0C34_12275 [Agarivorans sp. TSD2052]